MELLTMLEGWKLPMAEDNVYQSTPIPRLRGPTTSRTTSKSLRG